MNQLPPSSYLSFDAELDVSFEPLSFKNCFISFVLLSRIHLPYVCDRLAAYSKKSLTTIATPCIMGYVVPQSLHLRNPSVHSFAPSISRLSRWRRSCLSVCWRQTRWCSNCIFML